MPIFINIYTSRRRALLTRMLPAVRNTITISISTYANPELTHVRKRWDKLYEISP